MGQGFSTLADSGVVASHRRGCPTGSSRPDTLDMNAESAADLHSKKKASGCFLPK